MLMESRVLLVVYIIAVSTWVMESSAAVEASPVWGPEKFTPVLNLTRDLLSHYDPNVRPVLDHSQRIVVQHMFIISQIVYLDSKEQTLKALFYEVLTWRDMFLTWEPADYGGVEHIALMRDRVWLPDLVVFNQLSDNNNYYMRENMIPLNVRYDGTVKCETPQMLETTCTLDISEFPFDTQNCSLIVGSWSQPSSRISISITSSYIENETFNLNSEWDLTNTYACIKLKEYPGNAENFSEAHYMITLERRTAFYNRNLLIPTILVSLMSILVFLLPPESGEKVSLAITVFLSLSLNMLVISDHIPANSLQIPIASKYTLFSLTIVSVSLWLSVLVINVHGSRDSSLPFLSRPHSKLLYMCYVISPYLLVANAGIKPVKHSKQGCPSSASRVSKQSFKKRGLEIHQNGNVVNHSYSNIRANEPIAELLPLNSHVNKCEAGNISHLGGSSSSGSTRPAIMSDPQVQRLIDLMTDIAAKHRHDQASDQMDEESEKYLQEWSFVARCLDRLCAIAYLFANVGVLMVFLPYYFKSLF